MKIVFWLIKLVAFAFIGYIATTYWKGFGWWFLIICVILLMVVEALMNKKIEYSQKQNFFKKYPMLKKLIEGQVISIELKSGENLTNFIYIEFDGIQILVSKQPDLQKSEKEVDSIKGTRWIKLKKIKSIEIID